MSTKILLLREELRTNPHLFRHNCRDVFDVKYALDIMNQLGDKYGRNSDWRARELSLVNHGYVMLARELAFDSHADLTRRLLKADLERLKSIL